MNEAFVHDLVIHVIELYAGIFATVFIVYIAILFFRRMANI